MRAGRLMEGGRRISVYRLAEKRTSHLKWAEIYILKNLHIENDVLTHLRIHHQTSKCKVDG